MKKLLLSVIAILAFACLLPVVKAESNVTVYMFTKDGCPACASALEYFNGLLADDPDSFKLVDLEIFDSEWNEVSEDAYNLMINTLDHFGESTDPKDIATPLIVVGDYHTVGLPQDTSVVEDAIKDAKKAKEEVDVVKQIADEEKINYQDFVKVENENTNDSEQQKPGKYDAIIIVAIFVVLIGGFAGLVVLGKK